MGLLTSLVKTVVSVAVLPIAVVVDAVDVLDGNTQESVTKKTLNNAAENLKDSINELL